MNYSAIGLMSGSSLDGLDMILASFSETNGQWDYEISASELASYSASWKEKLRGAVSLPAEAYLLLHTSFGKYCGEKVTAFLARNSISKKPDVIGSHGHTTFHLPAQGMTHQLGDGAAIAAAAGIATVSDLRSVDVAFHGQGAPIVPIGEKMLFPGYRFFMNIGGICNVSVNRQKEVVGFDVSPANRVLNMLASRVGKAYDKGGMLASRGTVNQPVLKSLNALNYYAKPFPKSLANDFGTDIIFPLIEKSGISVADALATVCEHIAIQTTDALRSFQGNKTEKMLVTGGGALNSFLVKRLQYHLAEINIDVVIPDLDTVNYKEALIMALIAVLRLRNEPNVLASVTGATRDSCGGALWSVK